VLQVSPHVIPGLHGCIRIAENWTFSLFFAFAELWGTVMISVLFWTLANNVCTVKEAKTVYPMMGIPANIAVVAAGNFIKYVNTKLLAGCSTQTFLQAMVAAIVSSSAIMIAVRSNASRAECWMSASCWPGLPRAEQAPMLE
jgi:ATP:ADP antiporter, AAA family